MKIPRSITVNTGEDEEVHETMDRFFLEVKSEIEKKVGIKEGPPEFRMDVLNLCELTPSTPQASDNYAHIFFYKEKVVAAVFETRTDMNYIHFDYFFNITKPL
ncbi:MAG: hypothetical protein ABIE36_02330 [Candidatus Diapherotrites archaeon]